jgi:uncharacterized membrane protein
MNFIARNKYWISLVWFISILVFYKIYNNFVFENNESILFIILLVGVPTVLEIISRIAYSKNKKQYMNIKFDYNNSNNNEK